MTSTLGNFPVDDSALDHILHSLNGSYAVDDDGTHHLVGADFSFSQLLDFYSGYDEANLVEEPYSPGSDVYSYTKPLYSSSDVIRALVLEIKRLRALDTEATAL